MGWDVVVVGSGFGGAVAAGRLAARGLRVLVLERGPWWGPERAHHGDGARREFPRGVLGMGRSVRNVRWARGDRSREAVVAADGLFELHVFDALTALTGSGVGGGSLIYANIQAEPEADYFDGLPPELTATAMAPWYGRVRAMLEPAPLPVAQRPPGGDRFEDAAQAAEAGAVSYPDLAVYWGAEGPTRRTAQGAVQQACNHCGGCVLGCERGAKTTLDLTYLPLALRHGAEVRPLSEVVGIGQTRGGYQVRWLDHRTGQQLQLSTPRLVLAAGTLNTLRLLFTARDRHRAMADLPASLGRGFTGNGDSGAVMLRTGSDHRSTQGPSFRAFVPRKVAGHRFLTGEVGLPTAALGVPAWLRRRLDRTGLLISMGRAEATGTVGFDGAQVRTAMGRADDEGLYTTIDAEVQKLAAGYGAFGTWTNVAFGRRQRSLATVHPLGGASIGRSPAEGVVDHAGQVFGHRGLYVLDGAACPGAPGVPPSMTIAALAERAASLME